MTVFAIAAALGVVWLIGQAVTADARRAVILLAAAVAVASVAGKTLNDWRSGAYLFFAWLLFEDLIRKYMGNNMYVYFGKDALIGATYVALLMARYRGEAVPRFKVPFKFAFGLFFLLGLAQVFNPGAPSILYGLLGLKVYFYYVPLMFVGYAMLRTERDLHRFLVATMGLAAPVALLGVLQSVLGLNFLNPHSGAEIEELSHLVRYTPSGVAVPRPPSVFVSDGRFADYLTLALVLALGTAGYLLVRRTTRGRRIVFPALALIGLATMVTGGRGVFMYGIISAVLLSSLMLWGAPPKWGEGYRLVKAIRRSFVFVALAIAVAEMAFPDVIGARWTYYRETLSPDSPTNEVALRAWDYPFHNFLLAFTDRDWEIGHGIGTQTLGVQYVAKIVGKEVDESIGRFNLESGWAALIWEQGILGLILWLAWASSLVFEVFKVAMKLKGTWAFPLAISILWFDFYLLFPRTFGGLVGYEDFVLNAYFWLFVGVVFRLPALLEQGSSLQSTVDSQESTVNSQQL
jgi:hypothetical protein